VFFEGTRERCGVSIQISMPVQQHPWVVRIHVGDQPSVPSLHVNVQCSMGKTAILSHVFWEFKLAKVNLYFYYDAAFLV
jgi:hypothetical protein